MINFTAIENRLPEGYDNDTVFVVKCSEWNEEGFQICTFYDGEFHYDGQPNEMFMDSVESWAVIFEDIY